jgi:hypothetical protein
MEVSHVYCPNCGTKQKTETPGACPECQMPLGEVAGLVAKHRETMPRDESTAGIPKERLIGAAAFLALAAVPIGFGVKNGLLSKGSGS